MEHTEKQFIAGFNSGYLIAKHEPVLYTAVAKGLDSKSEFIQGLISGGKEYEKEKHTPNKGLIKTKDRDKDFDKDR